MSNAPPAPPPCPDCQGATVQFRGHGLDTQHRICPRYKEPGHLTEDEIRARIRAVVVAVRPSGRFA